MLHHLNSEIWNSIFQKSKQNCHRDDAVTVSRRMNENWLEFLQLCAHFPWNFTIVKHLNGHAVLSNCELQANRTGTMQQKSCLRTRCASFYPANSNTQLITECTSNCCISQVQLATHCLNKVLQRLVKNFFTFSNIFLHSMPFFHERGFLLIYLSPLSPHHLSSHKSTTAAKYLGICGQISRFLFHVYQTTNAQTCISAQLSNCFDLFLKYCFWEKKVLKNCLTCLLCCQSDQFLWQCQTNCAKR